MPDGGREGIREAERQREAFAIEQGRLLGLTGSLGEPIPAPLVEREREGFIVDRTQINADRAQRARRARIEAEIAAALAATNAFTADQRRFEASIAQFNTPPSAAPLGGPPGTDPTGGGPLPHPVVGQEPLSLPAADPATFSTDDVLRDITKRKQLLLGEEKGTSEEFPTIPIGGPLPHPTLPPTLPRAPEEPTTPVGAVLGDRIRRKKRLGSRGKF